MKRLFLKHMLALIGGVMFCFAFFFGKSKASETDEFRGPPFGDISVEQSMEDTWKGKGILRGGSMTNADLVVDLNQQLQPFLEPIVQRYAKERGLKIHVSRGTCGKSMGKISRKEINMGGFCCPPGDMDRLPGLRFHTLGIQAIAFFVHPDNPVDKATLDQVRNIYRGKIMRWSELGGKDMPIEAVGSLHCRKRPGHWRLMLDNENMFGPRFKEEGDMEDIIKIVASSPNAIGYETLLVADRFKKEWQAKPLWINGIHPSDLDRLTTLDYSIYRTFSITTWTSDSAKNAKADALADFLIEEINRIGSQYGLVSSKRLRENGWKFQGTELVGEPER